MLTIKVSLWESMIHCLTRSLWGRVWYIAQQCLFVGEYDTLPNKVPLFESMIHCPTSSLYGRVLYNEKQGLFCRRVWHFTQQGLLVGENDTLPNKFFLWESTIYCPTKSLCGRTLYIAQQSLLEGEYDTLPNKVSLWESMVHWQTRFLCGRI